jgi:hypothetical protein
VDHLFNASNTFFASYNMTDRYHIVPAVGSVAGVAAAGGESQVGGARFNDRSQHASAGYTHIFSARLLNELTLGFVRFQHNEIARNQGHPFEQDFGIPGTVTTTSLATWPTFNVAGYSIPSEGRSIRYWNGTMQAQDSVIIQRGSHSVKLGFMAMQSSRSIATAPAWVLTDLPEAMFPASEARPTPMRSPSFCLAISAA